MSDPSEDRLQYKSHPKSHYQVQVQVVNTGACHQFSLMSLQHLGFLSAKATSLAGSVPFHKAYILLHGQHSPRTFPSRLASPLLVALRQRALRWSALVNVAWVPPNDSGHVSDLSEEETDGNETYSLLAFASSRRRLRIPSVSMDNFEDTCAQLNNHMEHSSTDVRVVDPYGLHLYVCTHGARDCRCGEWGSKVADAFREEIFKRRQTDPTGLYSWIVMGEVGHVGGHQSAYSLSFRCSALLRQVIILQARSKRACLPVR